MNDASLLAREIAGDAASNTANRIKPSEDRLNQIDQPAEDNTWHDVPDLNPAALKAQARDQYNKAKSTTKNEAQNAVNDANATAQDPNADTQAGLANTAGNVKQNAVQNISQNVPEEHKEKARDLQHRAKGYLGEKVPKERRDQTIYRLKKTIVEIQSHSDCMFAYPNW